MTESNGESSRNSSSFIHDWFKEEFGELYERYEAGDISLTKALLIMAEARESDPEETGRSLNAEDEEDRSWSHAAPVFAPNYDEAREYPNGDKLPGVWITAPIWDREGNPIGRNCIDLYSPAVDPNGENALYHGGCYYDEGMSYTDPADHDKRIECFEAAEFLYRHSAGWGNAVASMCLGYVYSYDRCEGRYWRDPMTFETEEDYRRPYPREERAFECFAVAAEAGIGEACYKLGDMYKHGIGCDPDAAEAFRWYVRASELSANEAPVILGSAALRLAGCYEEGFGCGQDFDRALECYREAVAGLEFAVEHGKTWYEKALAEARAGEKRCLQEIV